ncbi:tetratricopeptide repeat protein [Bythopirellula polymerisocia]|uniref:tetratricopeptide repeat protein n=1 Tax=Bythopirellula polymerisocia TaxID=2528003 RepID=UPI0011B76FE9|nr:CDC27 family protein [Bythopirellula polymerisocia]
MKKSYIVVLGAIVTSIGLFASVGCKDSDSHSTGRRSVGRQAQARQDNLSVLLDTVAKTLNALPNETVLDLVPPVPILDDSTSADGNEVLAILGVNPQDPEGGNNFLSVPAGNGNFRGLRVKAGDIVRYFIDYDEESYEHGGGVEVDYIELPVRRLDTNNAQNALILDVSLGGPVVEPHRIEIWRFSDQRMNEIRLRLTRYVRQRRPAIAWEPTPDETALVQLADRANQWFRNLRPSQVTWELSKLIDTLPATVRDAGSIAPLLTPEALRDGLFDLADIRSLQEAIWLRDIAAWAKQDAYKKVDIALALFDWTIRNIQLDESDQPGIVHQPWQALMYGHGSAEMRAWVFAGLCLQQQLDVVMLSVTNEKEESKWWLPAVWIDGEFYLFDPLLGLPILDAEAEHIATLSEVIADPSLLRNLDLDDKHPYPITADDMSHVSASVVATPLQLSRRAAALQNALEGEDYVVLAAPSKGLVDYLKAQTEFTEVALWPFPYEQRLAEEAMKRPQRELAAQQVLTFCQRPRLWKARVLHFQGTKPIPVSQQNDPLAQPNLGHREAIQNYQHTEIRTPDAVLDLFDAGKQIIYRSIKYSASYWLGLLSYDLGKFEVAEDWFLRRTLEPNPDGFWTPGAQYNLARTLEQLGRTDEAITILEADQSPQRHGNLLRARRIADTENSDSSPAE